MESGIKVRLEEGTPVVFFQSESGERPLLRLDSGSARGGVRRSFHPLSADRIGVRVAVEQAVFQVARQRSLVDRWRCLLPMPWDGHWVPHLRPDPEFRMGAHCFRSPAVIILSQRLFLALIPDLSDSDTMPWIRHAMLDLDISNPDEPSLAYGLEPTRPARHVYFERDPETDLEPVHGVIRHSYEIVAGEAETRGAALRSVVNLLWRHHGGRGRSRVAASIVSPSRLAETSYPTLFEGGWFVQFPIGGDTCGAFRAESHHADYFERPDPVVWNQYWFNAQRSAYGLAHYGRTLRRPEWTEAAEMTVRMTLAAPSWQGLFPAIYAYESADWWGSIPRLNGGRDRVHIADAAMTGEWLLRYHLDHRRDDAIVGRCTGLGDAIVGLQRADGSIAPWHDWDGNRLTHVPELARSGETGAAAAYLALLASNGLGKAYGPASQRAAEFLTREIMPSQRYQDFETFYSCSPKELDFEDPFTGVRPQNSLAMFWVATTMARLFDHTGEGRYLDLALEATDQLSLYQQIWSPPFLSIEGFGGFGVMNTDAEWHDARQSLFVPLYFDLHRLTGEREFLERGIAAADASFVLACMPEHEPLNPKGFNAHPPGIMPENYAHSGRDAPSGRSDTCWGECGALSMTALLERHHNMYR